MQQIALVTLGVADVERSVAFYRGGFGWNSVFEAPGIAFFQMNGLVFALWGRDDLATDMQRPAGAPGGMVLRAADAPPYGGWRGYVADPDGHAWEIAWNPAWPIDPQGHVRFAL